MDIKSFKGALAQIAEERGWGEVAQDWKSRNRNLAVPNQPPDTTARRGDIRRTTSGNACVCSNVLFCFCLDEVNEHEDILHASSGLDR